MTFYDFISKLSDSELEDYANRADTTARYIRNHLKCARKIPRPKLMNALWKNTGGKVSREELHNHFLPVSEAA